MTKQLKTQFNIIAIFAVVIFASFIPEMYPNFFGDYYCSLKHNHGFDHINPVWHWGFRHWAWIAMGISIFIYNITTLIDND